MRPEPRKIQQSESAQRISTGIPGFGVLPFTPVQHVRGHDGGGGFSIARAGDAAANARGTGPESFALGVIRLGGGLIVRSVVIFGGPRDVRAEPPFPGEDGLSASGSGFPLPPASQSDRYRRQSDRDLFAGAVDQRDRGRDLHGVCLACPYSLSPNRCKRPDFPRSCVNPDTSTPSF